MPLFMDVHTFGTATSAAGLIQAWETGLATEGGFGVSYLRYWVCEPAGKVFCLVEADDPDLILSRRGEATYPVAHEIYPVSERVRRRPDPGSTHPDRPTRGRGTQ